MRLGVLIASMLTTGCGGGVAEPPADPELIKACGRRGAPVTLSKLVEVFRANGVTLAINERECGTDLMVAEATNLGPSRLEKRDDAARREGDILCSVGFENVGREVRTIKYETDEETYVDVLNVNCSLYPFDAASENKQVERLRKALEALVLTTP